MRQGGAMSNRQLIKTAHIWFLTVVVALGLLAVAGKADINSNGQNANQNSNSNSNTSNTNTSQNRNANRSNRNANTTRATGEQTGMGNLNSRDHDFIMDAAMGGLEEVELGHIA